MKRKITLQDKIFTFLFHLIGALSVIVFLTLIVSNVINVRDEFHAESEIIFKVLEPDVVPILEFDYDHAAQTLLDPFKGLGTISYVGIFKENGDLLVESHGPQGPDFFTYQKILVANGQKVGTIILTLDPYTKVSGILKKSLTMFGIFFLILLLALHLSRRAAAVVTNDLKKISEMMATTANSGSFDKRIEDMSDIQEIYDLTQSFNSLLNDLLSRDVALQDLNKNLEKKVKVKTAQLEDAQRKLINEAHLAGMAEIASGTVHNIGNVLTSIQTRVSLLRENVQLSTELDRLEKLNNLILTIEADHEQWNNIKTMYQLIHEQLFKKFQNFEVTCGEAIEYCRICIEIIHFQQSLTIQKANFSHVTIRSVLDSFKSIKDNYIREHLINIQVSGNLEGEILVFESRLLSVLINLLYNANEAMVDNKILEKKIYIDVVDEEKFVRIDFRNAGPLIPKSISDKFFRSGFTTKQGGHGFGLHSSANYIQEMGGSITFDNHAKSPCFVIRLKRPETSSKVS